MLKSIALATCFVVSISSAAFAGNTVILSQTGVTNLASVSQNGVHNSVIAAQTGHTNIAVVGQVGFSNSASLGQYGYGHAFNSATVVQSAPVFSRRH